MGNNSLYPRRIPYEMVAGLTFDHADARDVSGNGYTGTLTGDATPTAGAISFSGAGYVSVPNMQSVLGTSYSVMAWAYFDSLSANRTVLDSTTSDAFETFQSILWRIIFIQSTGVIRFQVRDKNLNSNFVDAAFSSSGSWHHFAMVRAGSAVTGYVDAVAVGTESGATIGAHSATHYNTVGAVRNQGVPPISNHMVGDVDDARFYKAALTATEIAQNYQDNRSLYA